MINHDPRPTIALLNEILEKDRSAIEGLVNTRVPCNKELADHPTVQVGHHFPTTTEPPATTVGLLGILNGIFGTYDDGPQKGYGPITAVVDDEDLTRIIRFELTDPSREAGQMTGLQ